MVWIKKEKKEQSRSSGLPFLYLSAFSSIVAQLSKQNPLCNCAEMVVDDERMTRMRAYTLARKIKKRPVTRSFREKAAVNQRVIWKKIAFFFFSSIIIVHTPLSEKLFHHDRLIVQRQYENPLLCLFAAKIVLKKNGTLASVICFFKRTIALRHFTTTVNRKFDVDLTVTVLADNTFLTNSNLQKVSVPQHPKFVLYYSNR